MTVFISKHLLLHPFFFIIVALNLHLVEYVKDRCLYYIFLPYCIEFPGSRKGHDNMQPINDQQLSWTDFGGNKKSKFQSDEFN